MKESAYTLRWLITNKWGSAEDHAEALSLIDEIVGQPAPGKKASPKSRKTSREALPKVALVVGHNSVAKGAFAGPGVNQFEYDFNNEVANQITEMGASQFESKRFNRRSGRGYRREIDDAYNAVNAWKPDLVIELHFNGGGGDYICMLAAKSSANSQRLAATFQQAFVEALGFRDRGIITRSRGERGGRSLYAAKAPTILTEPFFGDDPAHCKAIGKLGHEGVAGIYVEAIVDTLAIL